MSAKSIPSFRQKCRRVASLLIFSLLLVLSMSMIAAPPGPEIDAKVAGRWQVSARQGHLRVYEVSERKYVKIIGGGLADRGGRLNAQADGSYILKLDGEELQKVRYVPATDELEIEHFDRKKDFDRGLPSTWKTLAKRMMK